MTTFTLTPDNADDIPKNIVHLIVQEGVIEIPEDLFLSQRSLETVVMAYSVKIIYRNAFFIYTNLESIVFPDDSQLEEIRRLAFCNCVSLQSVIIPKSVCVCVNIFSLLLYVFFNEQVLNG